MSRINGKDPDAPPANDLARPVADLKAALERVSATMAASGMDIGASPAASGPAAAASHNAEILAFPPNDPMLDGPPYVLAPTAETPLALGSAPSHSYSQGLGAPPPIQAPPLSKDELAAVYQAVADKGVQLDLAAVKGGFIPGAPGQPAPLSQVPVGADQSGYYYYFFPIRDLADKNPQNALQSPQQLQAQQQLQQLNAGPSGGGEIDKETAMGIMASLAGDPSALMQGNDGNKSVEPLFMAMSGFIGMTLMFVMSVLFLPKWGALRSRGVTALKHAPDELASLTKLVVQSIEGKDCSERIACEVGRAVRTMHLGNKPLKVLEIILPPHLSKQISHIRKAVKKAEKCNFIPCKYPAWYSASTAKPPFTITKPTIFKPTVFKPTVFKPTVFKPSIFKPGILKPLIDKLPTKLQPSATSPRPIDARSTPRSRPLPQVKLILSKNNERPNNNNNNNVNKRKGPKAGAPTAHPARDRSASPLDEEVAPTAAEV
ncbi:uncharacterized protein LOC117641130 [Thrips palmi]|uniref:Uncharacterized protein LOC117641130 n=1 Tax=Thrips palmi TaxID=161013 RepID=A0A6P8Y3Q1_THRPL|nr:uncharacterized protein LOC117641130 [Thrips palmi]